LLSVRGFALGNDLLPLGWLVVAVASLRANRALAQAPQPPAPLPSTTPPARASAQTA